MGEMVKTRRLDLAKLFDEDMLGDDLDAWLAESSLMSGRSGSAPSSPA